MDVDPLHFTSDHASNYLPLKGGLPEDRERLLGLLFRHTTTLGVRENVCRRYTLERGERTVDTPHGPVRLKTASGWGVVRSKPEYEDVARIARGQGISLAEVFDWLK